MLQVMARNWWMLAVRGVLAILFGIALFVWPGLSLVVLVNLVGAYMLVDGVFSVVHAIQGRAGNPRWWVALLEGFIGVIAGIGTFLWPGLTGLVLLYLISFWAILTGITEVYAAWHLRKEIDNELWLGLSGIASIIFGIILILFPGTGALAVLTLISVYAIVFGIIMLMLAFRLRGMGGTNVSARA